MDDPGYSYFRKRLKDLTGIDVDFYKGNQLERRLKGIMTRVKVSSLYDYARLLEREPARLQEFKDYFTINVSEFFRNPERFTELKERILPALLKERRGPKIWSAGCSYGAEPYSVAILLQEVAPFGQYDILATDIDETILGKAREGFFQGADLKNVSEERLKRFFQPDGPGYRIKPELKRRVHFQHHNLLLDPFPQELDLILCRNVVIYFTEEAKRLVYRNFHRSLRPGGLLFVGGTESLFGAREIGFEGVGPFFYRKISG
ncbi:MAG: protein-glutamate O-methyltransferase CheR [Firmicutes bacterium]|nr:protein-glutamate O-methyltransferase CheR [Bacillota bacterium]MCL5040847.1 protein-glutamate O-methyltransferase CheR [Bacillota bacterium]